MAFSLVSLKAPYWHFLVFINDLEKDIKSKVKFFADDTMLFDIVKDPHLTAIVPTNRRQTDTDKIHWTRPTQQEHNKNEKHDNRNEKNVNYNDNSNNTTENQHNDMDVNVTTIP